MNADMGAQNPRCRPICTREMLLESAKYVGFIGAYCDIEAWLLEAALEAVQPSAPYVS